METMTEVLYLRLTPKLKAAIRARATHLGLRMQDIVRMDLAKASLGSEPLERADRLVDERTQYFAEKEPA